MFRDAGPQRDDARNIGGIGWLGDASENDFRDFTRVDAGACQEGGACVAPEVIGSEIREISAQLAEGRADGGDDMQT